MFYFLESWLKGLIVSGVVAIAAVFSLVIGILAFSKLGLLITLGVIIVTFVVAWIVFAMSDDSVGMVSDPIVWEDNSKDSQRLNELCNRDYNQYGDFLRRHQVLGLNYMDNDYRPLTTNFRSKNPSRVSTKNRGSRRTSIIIDGHTISL